MSYWRISNGVAPTRILQSVARGVLGRAAFDGGAPAAVLGGVLHYVIALSMAIVYYLVSRTYVLLIRRPIACGLGYGILLYAIMNLVVLPLSAVGMPRFSPAPWVALSIVMHLVFGVICALAARRADASGSSGASGTSGTPAGTITTPAVR
jgi:hypothetical protein